MADISVGTLVDGAKSLIKFLPAFLLRRRYNKSWLQSRIGIDLRPRNEPLRIIGGELPQVSVWLNITNHTYFLIELDRLNLDFFYAAMKESAFHHKKTEVPPNSTITLFLEMRLTTEQLAHIKKHKDTNNIEAAIQVTAEFNSPIFNFSVTRDRLTGISPSFMNI